MYLKTNTMAVFSVYVGFNTTSLHLNEQTVVILLVLDKHSRLIGLIKKLIPLL